MQQIDDNDDDDAWLCSILYLTSDMGLHYLTFMRRNMESIKKLTPSRRMNSKNIVNSVAIVRDSVAMNCTLVNNDSYE